MFQEDPKLQSAILSPTPGELAMGNGLHQVARITDSYLLVVSGVSIYFVRKPKRIQRVCVVVGIVSAILCDRAISPNGGYRRKTTRLLII
jgi:hypothetical protein